MAGSSGSCSFVKQEKIESENYGSESRSSGGDLDTNCQNEDLNDELQNEKTGKSSTASPVYQKLCKKSAGQLSNQQPDSQSSNNNNSIKMGKNLFLNNDIIDKLKESIPFYKFLMRLYVTPFEK